MHGCALRARPWKNRQRLRTVSPVVNWRMRIYRVLFLSVMIVVLDQGTKAIVTDQISLGESIPVIGELVKFTHIKNPGMAFGLRLGNRLFFTIFSSVASVVILLYVIRMRDHALTPLVALTLILGGAVGNLIDRIRFGEVTDFIDVGISSYRWPVFNVADSAVTIGMTILVGVLLLKRDQEGIFGT